MSMNAKAILMLGLCGALAGCAANFPAPVSDLSHDYSSLERGSYRGSYYQVRAGDTLYFISYITDKDVDEIARYNHLSQPYLIHPGQILKLWHPAYIPPAYGGTGAGPSTAVTSTPAPTPVARPPVHSTTSVKHTASAPVAIATPIPVPPPVSTVKPTVKVASSAAPAPKPSVKSPPQPKPAPNAKSASSVKSTPSAKPKPTVKPKPVPVPAKPKPAPAPKPAPVPKPAPRQSVAQKPVTVKKESKPHLEQKPSKGYVGASKQNVNKTTSSTAAANDKISKWFWPTRGRVIRNFSAGDQGNRGIDIAGQRGQPVTATAAGTVVYSGNALRGYGNLVIIKHNDDYLSAYAHNDQLLVHEGQAVKAGQKIATMGSSGTSSVRLHFEIRYQGKSVNPRHYLP